ncbi:MAG TPA: aminopeptidase [Spirochaetota bacterium]|nr:aminopeptidase [Spirochaetota bacterium]HPC39775.1 aminopeptidase [Spirochaetota bacterium]HPL18884.1 aminopeptidase [Spirochaetota bacterium]HQF07503.1 aminopeptidase [Spirochaetota bacterium]HQH96763.1 aminopeptidase [Spirochaetota bacterium]
MLSASQIEKYADVLIWGLETARTKPFRPYDVILLRYQQPSIALAEALYRKLLHRKWIVVLRGLVNPVMEKDFYTCTDPRQRKFIGEWEKSFFSNINGTIFLSAPESLTHLRDVDPKRINEAMVAARNLRRIMERREERGLVGWTLCTYPTEEPARRAGISIREYANQIIKACFLNDRDPVARWKEIYANSMEIKKWLKSLAIRTIRVESKSFDLSITLGEKRRFLGLSGHNIPSFEIFTSPDWRGTSGTYYANLPSYRSGNLVKGVRLEFKNGSAVKARAVQGEAFLRKMIAMDRGACRVGEFSLTDRRFSRIDRFMADTLFDENFGGPSGNCHVAIGNSYSDTFAGNPATLTAAAKKKLGYNESALHWDLVNTEEKTVTARLAGGKNMLLYEKGKFVY